MMYDLKANCETGIELVKHSGRDRKSNFYLVADFLDFIGRPFSGNAYLIGITKKDIEAIRAAWFINEECRDFFIQQIEK